MKHLYIFILVFILSAPAVAQDIHYSQFFNAPLLLNPALTGFTPGQYRVAVNYRNQWFSATNLGFGKSPFMTTAIGGDVPIHIKNDVLGVGLFIMDDQAGANTFSTVMTCASVSYIKTLGKNQRQRLAGGFEAGYTAETVNPQNFQWASQFTDNVFMNSLPTNESLLHTHIGYLNMNAGLFWFGHFNDYFGMYAGGSFFNVTTPKFDVLAGENRDLYWRWNMHTGLDLSLSRKNKEGTKYHILPSMMYMNQGPDNQFNLGLGFGADFTESMMLTVGLYSRFNTLNVGVNPDAIIPYLAFDLKGFKLGMSYDATISTLKSSGSMVGALEFSVTYQPRGKHYDPKHALVSPRF
jgi:type IX secretion system PorP/SprF family membrane protein